MTLLNQTELREEKILREIVLSSPELIEFCLASVQNKLINN